MNPTEFLKAHQNAAPIIVETTDASGTTRQHFQHESSAASYEQRAANCGFTTQRIKSA